MCRSDTGSTGLPSKRKTGWLTAPEELGRRAGWPVLTWTSWSSLGRWNCHSLQKFESCSRNPTVWSASSKHARLCTVRTAFRHCRREQSYQRDTETPVYYLSACMLICRLPGECVPGGLPQSPELHWWSCSEASWANSPSRTRTGGKRLANRRSPGTFGQNSAQRCPDLVQSPDNLLGSWSKWTPHKG